MTDADVERVVKHVFRNFTEGHHHVYVTSSQVRAVVAAAVALRIVDLKEHTYVKPCSGLENLT